IHVFKPRRIGQLRGKSWLSSIIVKMHEIDQYDDAELVRKKGAALLGSGYITEPMGSQIDPADYFGKREAEDREGRDVIALEPGTYPILPAGMEPKFPNPPDVGTSYAPWKQDHYRQVAKGMGVTYEQFTGDLSNTSYSSIRAGLLEFRRRVKQIQFQTFVFQVCRPIIHTWMNTAVLYGALSVSPSYYLANIREFRNIDWRPDGFPWVDPVKDQVAEQMARRNGFKSRAQIVAETFGGDIDIVDREIMEENERADRDGLVYDTDSRKTAQSGAMQKAVIDSINE
ncbi:MAG: phage portal protein, partial [Deltaproteobacteria bacterium]|nr:phage portal protein [Deltaproteobacteria bacterium]